MDAIDRLTGRQKDCLRLVADGYTSKEIGRRLGISPSTVDNHVDRANEVLGLDNRNEAARLLRAHEASKPLPSKPVDLAERPETDPVQGTGQNRSTWWQRLVPPLGGSRNELNWEAKSYAILRVALLCLVALILMTLGVSTLLWAVR